MKRSWIVIGMLAVSSCGKDDEPLTSSQFCGKYADEVCAALSPACLIPKNTCTTAQVAQCTADAQQSFAMFRDFIPANADACLRKVREVYSKLNQGAVALKSSDLDAMSTACARVYQGTSDSYGPCTVDEDCLGHLICDKGFCGVRKVVAQGAGCANIGEVCPLGYYCGDNGAGRPLCLPKLNVQNVCGSSGPCLETLRCSAGLCVPRLDYGELCTADDECASGFCEPYALRCADDVRFAPASPACNAYAGI